MARWLRIAVSGAFVFHSLFGPWGVEPVFAQNPDTIMVGVTPVSTTPPAAISDLLASANLAVGGQVSLTWTAPQGNAGGIPLNNQPVAAYSLHLATFSVVSVSGDTTTWWNSTNAGSVLLQGPTNTPKPPGQLESYAFSGLIPGATYYFGIKSISQGGITSPIDSESASPALQASAVTTKFPAPTGAPPQRPNGLSASASAGQFTLKWHAVTLDTNQRPITIDHYLVSRYDTIGSSPTVSATVLPSNSPSYTDTVGGLTYFYRIFAVAAGGATSAASDYVDSSNQLNRYAIAPADIESRIVIPGSLALELNAGPNGTSDDYEIVAIRQTQNENATTLKSCLFQVQNARTAQAIANFAFSQPVAEVHVSYALAFATLGLSSSLAGQVSNQGAQAQAIAQLISLYWFNGSGFIRLGGTVLVQNQALMVSARNMGLYEIRAVSSPSSFALTRNSPYPRVISPNGAENRRVFWFFDNPSGDEVTGTIYDIRGAKVRGLAVNSQSPTSNSLVWDGKDDQGATVPSGVYLYKIEAGKEKATGTVVVAR